MDDCTFWEICVFRAVLLGYAGFIVCWVAGLAPGPWWAVFAPLWLPYCALLSGLLIVLAGFALVRLCGVRINIVRSDDQESRHVD